VREPKENDVVLVPISPDRYNDPAQLLRKFVAAAGISDDSSRDAPSPPPRRVRFARSLVTDIRTRPRTRPEDQRVLYYTYEETQRFRQEYRLERNPGSCFAGTTPTPSGEKEDLESEGGESAFQGPLGSNSRPHHISRVVVRHHDTLATFYDANLLSMNDPDDSTEFGVKNDKNGDFFDNDCFWSGSITWY
jgi:hypothetical protein